MILNTYVSTQHIQVSVENPNGVLQNLKTQSFRRFSVPRLARIKKLRELAESFFEKSSVCTKLSDATAFADLALRMHAEADEVENESKLDSVFVYISFIENFQYNSAYPDYLEFCIRNAMTAICEEDYETALEVCRATAS